MAYWDNLSKKSYLGGNDMTSDLSGGQDFASTASPATAGAASGAGGAAAMSNPAAAGIMMGGSFLSNYLAQKAQDEREKRNREMQIEQNYAQNQNQGFDTMMKAFGGALR